MQMSSKSPLFFWLLKEKKKNWSFKSEAGIYEVPVPLAEARPADVNSYAKRGPEVSVCYLFWKSL